jgi:RNA polymerase sigma-70 factor (ECF subfamily)
MPVTPFIEKIPEPTDEVLLERMRLGDMQAFNMLFERHSRRGVELSMTIVHDHFTAEEVVSDVFFSFWVRKQELPEIPLFQPYLFTAIRYRARKMLAVKTGKVEMVSLDNYIMQPEDSPADPFNQLHTGELVKTLHKLVEQLPPQRKLIFKLSRMNGLSYKAIAEILSISESTVKNQLATALKTLRNELAIYSGPLPMVIVFWLSLPSDLLPALLN